jgi:hypothetical protein
VFVLSVLFVGATAGCESGATSPISPPALVQLSSAVTVEPLVVQPEFLHAGSCARVAPFGLRLRVILGGHRNLILRGLRFRLTDRFGTSALPEVIPIPTGSEAALPTPQSTPLPGATALPSSPIPIPGASPMTGVSVAAGASQPLPFFLRFGCGVLPEGTLFIMTDIADGNGRSDTSQLRVRVGR